MTNMIDFYHLIPFFFFICVVYLSFSDKSVAVFRRFDLKISKNIVWSIPMRELKRQIEENKDEVIINELRQCLKSKRYLIFSIILFIFSLIIVGLLPL